jgi:hypothetical protein
MTRWVGDPTIGSPDLPSSPVDGLQPLVPPRWPLRGNSDQLRRRAACCRLPPAAYEKVRRRCLRTLLTYR